ncbi:MAG TPA: hypothetical protein PLT66_06570 [Bacillota bacterium]|nr:hypothetical protein [Bacillota bacterium]
MNNNVFDENTRKKLVSLTDAQLQQLIGDISAAVNADAVKTKMLMSDPARVRAILGSMTDEQAEKLLAGVDRDKAMKAAQKLREL